MLTICSVFGRSNGVAFAKLPKNLRVCASTVMTIYGNLQSHSSRHCPSCNVQEQSLFRGCHTFMRLCTIVALTAWIWVSQASTFPIKLWAAIEPELIWRCSTAVQCTALEKEYGERVSVQDKAEALLNEWELRSYHQYLLTELARSGALIFSVNEPTQDIDVAPIEFSLDGFHPLFSALDSPSSTYFDPSCTFQDDSGNLNLLWLFLQ